MRRIAAAAALVGLAVLTGGAARADEPAFKLQRLSPTTGQYLLSLESDRVRAHLGWSVALWVDYAHRPLAVRTVGSGSKEPLIDGAMEIDVTGAIGLFDLVEVGLLVPVIPYRSGTGVDRRSDLTAYSMGDLALRTKVALLHLQNFGLAVAVDLTVPTAQGELAGEETVSFQPRLVAGAHFGPAQLVLNAGYLIREETEGQGVAVDDELDYGLGVVVTPIEMIDLVAEISGGTQVFNAWKRESESPLDALGGVRLKLLGGALQLTAAGGAGVLPGYGSPQWRVRVGAAFVADGDRDRDGDGIENPVDDCIDIPEDKDGFEDKDGCPDKDNDRDGLLDPWDRCPDQAEDPDGFEDEDGCPDPDNDRDNIADGVDRCPIEPEDMDGFQDTDGCPEPDNDKDGVLDGDDLCINEPELINQVHDEDGCPEYDGDGDGIFDIDDKCPVDTEDADDFEDADGCPDKDNDKDGFQDFEDKCPDEPEIINGVDDEDGCPDEGQSSIQIVGRKIALGQKLHFKTNSAKIHKRSYSILQQLAATLRAHPEIKLLSIEGHTDDRGGRKFNQKLSEDRAYSVRRFLVHGGISPFRLKAVGYGKERPLLTGASKRAHATNRRVEFIIEIGEGD